MASIYLSYRPGDNDAVAGRLYDQLVERFGRDAVIWREPGGATPEHPTLEALPRDAVVVVALVGPRWLHDAGAPATAMPPLSRPDDPVRLDLEAAQRRRLPVLAVVTQGAAMPQAPYLPPALQPLAALQPLPMRNDPDFHRDMERLEQALARYVAPLAVVRGTRGLSLQAFALLSAVALLVVALAAAGVLVLTRAGVGPFAVRRAATATATPIITRTPALVTLMTDPLTGLVDYGGVPNTWAVHVSGDCSFAGGGYQVLGAPDVDHINICNGPQRTEARDERITITTRLITVADPHAYYGIYFRSGDAVASAAYEFAITPSGDWNTIDSMTGQSLAHGTSSAIHTGVGATNTLAVDAYGAVITLSVNGVRLSQITDSNHVSGESGCIVEHGLVVVYTNFVLQVYQ